MEPIDVSGNIAARPSRIIWEWAYSNLYTVPDRLFHARLDGNWIFPVTAIIEQHTPDSEAPNDYLFQVVFICGSLEVRYPMPSGNLDSLKKQAAELLYGEYGLNLYMHFYYRFCTGEFFPAQIASVNDKYQLTKLMEYGTDAAD